MSFKKIGVRCFSIAKPKRVYGFFSSFKEAIELNFIRNSTFMSRKNQVGDMNVALQF